MHVCLSKRLSKERYTKRLTTELLYHTHASSGLVQSAWLRCCTLIYSKPRLILVFGGRDPIVVRRLGESEDTAEHLNLGLNYHLDSYLDEDSKRFSEEFPQIFQVWRPLSAEDAWHAWEAGVFALQVVRGSIIARHFITMLVCCLHFHWKAERQTAKIHTAVRNACRSVCPICWERRTAVASAGCWETPLTPLHCALTCQQLKPGRLQATLP